MIKGELQGLLKRLAPEKRWSKSSKLKDYVEFTLARFPDNTDQPDERRALELAHVLWDRERR